MQDTTNCAQPRLDLHASRPVSIFICPCRRTQGDRTAALEALSSQSLAQTDHDRLLRIEFSDLNFTEECAGLRAYFRPQAFILPEVDWIALALEAELAPMEGSSISFQQLLAFNSNMRVCQGELERPDNPLVNGEEVQFMLSSRRRVGEVFRDVAIEALGSFEPPATLTRAVTIGIAYFTSPLSDSDLYSFGTIAHSDEVVDPDWAARTLRDQVHDRWRSAGIRLFMHSYSLVASCSVPRQAPKQDLAWFRPIFRGPYVRLGARMAMERAGLLQMASAIHDIKNVRDLRDYRTHWVDFRRNLGLRWTPEKTQRVHVERMWRDISGLRQMSEEIDKCLDQTAGAFEAQATGRLNRVMGIITVVIGSFGVGELTAQLTQRLGWVHNLAWTIGMSATAAVALFLWLRWRWGKDSL